MGWEQMTFNPDVRLNDLVYYQVFYHYDTGNEPQFEYLVLAFQVWDYISKIQSSSTKEVLLMAFKAASVDEKKSYQDFYEYLKKRNR
jgi:hypothetical protein